jgi:hypothetical protein
MTTSIDTAELRRLLAEATMAESRLDDTTPHDGSDAYDTALGACLSAQDAYRAAVDDALPALLDAADERDALRADVARLRDALVETRKGDATDGRPCWCPSPTYAKRHGGSDHSPNCMRQREVLAATEMKP